MSVPDQARHEHKVHGGAVKDIKKQHALGAWGISQTSVFTGGESSQYWLPQAVAAVLESTAFGSE